MIGIHGPQPKYNVLYVLSHVVSGSSFEGSARSWNDPARSCPKVTSACLGGKGRVNGVNGVNEVNESRSRDIKGPSGGALVILLILLILVILVILVASQQRSYLEHFGTSWNQDWQSFCRARAKLTTFMAHSDTMAPRFPENFLRNISRTPGTVSNSWHLRSTVQE